MLPGSLLTFLTAGAVAAQAAGGEINHTFWYLARVAGFCAYLMLVANMALGIALSVPLLERRVMKWRIFDLHQVTGLTFVGLLLLHVVALLGDAYMGYTLPQLLVPFLSTYRPLPVAIGVLTFYLSLLVTFTFYVRRQIGQRAWRLIHFGSYAVFALSLLHGIYAGTDTATPWAIVLYGAGLALAGGLTWWRVGVERIAPAARTAVLGRKAS
jgi:predicted ferric reductase